jgi:hypothetical protein
MKRAGVFDITPDQLRLILHPSTAYIVNDEVRLNDDTLPEGAYPQSIAVTDLAFDEDGTLLVGWEAIIGGV